MRISILLAGLLAAIAARAAELRDLRLMEGPDGTRAVFELDARTQPVVFTLANPDRVVVDFRDVRRADKSALNAAPRGLIKAVRSGPREQGLRVVFDVGAPVSPQSFALEATGGFGYRVIVDLARGAAAAPADPVPKQPAQIVAGAEPAPVPAAVAVVKPEPKAEPRPEAKPEPKVEAQRPAPPVAAPEPAPPVVAQTSAGERVQISEKPIVVAVDAGHGGIDPGAHGRGGLLEKDVTLAIALKLARKIDAQPGMRAVLTRPDDTFVELRERTNRARRAQADLFVSVHANAYSDRDMRGTAVYVLSDRGATSEQARWVANHENAADLVGGVKLKNKGDDLAAVLIDISQSATMEASFDLGGRLLDALGQINELQKPAVQQAGFMVLKSPDIPSVLVETAFITNPLEERLLRDNAYQDKMAGAIFDGVRGYFARYRPLRQVAINTPEPAPQARARAMPVNLARGGAN